MITTALAALLMTGVHVEAQRLSVRFDPVAHRIHVESTLEVRGDGVLRLRLTDRATGLEGATVAAAPRHRAPGTIELDVAVAPEQRAITIAYDAVLAEDVAAGEQPGAIHNHSVAAHVGPEGVFLSDGAAWHPHPLDASGRSMLHVIHAALEPLDGWAFVASGSPVAGPARDGATPAAAWTWTTPRAVDGLAVAGNRHELHGRVHETAHGPVEVVMHAAPAHASLAPLFVDAACAYLDLYTPRLGAFPYRRFSIVENFFSSGFAYPGFTLLGPQVVGMAPRSLAPGYLDHELVHNWWGNGVYVDPDDGNWCEALTSYCANYWRRTVDGGAAAGRAYRRGVLMKLSTDPDGLDDGPLGAFGRGPSAGGAGRFVGYDKGAFVFMMLEDVMAAASATGAPAIIPTDADDPVWRSLRRFAAAHLGRRAGWDDLQAAFEAERPERAAGWLDGFFEFWVRQASRPRTGGASVSAFAEQLPAAAGQSVDVRVGAGGATWEIDPEFRLYRVLPPGQIIPTVAGTLGTGGCAVEADRARPEVATLLAMVDHDAHGDNLLLVGRGPAAARAALVARTTDPGSFDDGSFTVGGVTYGEPDQAVLHTMQHPDRPGRFVTVFHANGPDGWSRLRVIRFYTRDTTVVWSGGRVIERRVFEPARLLP